jgi:hypothetical protein
VGGGVLVGVEGAFVFVFVFVDCVPGLFSQVVASEYIPEKFPKDPNGGASLVSRLGKKDWVTMELDTYLRRPL